MHKAELVQQIAEKADISTSAAQDALNAVLDQITLSLSRKETVSLVGFGSFSVKSRAARVGKNPKTGEPIDIPASFSPGFKPGKVFKEAVDS